MAETFAIPEVPYERIVELANRIKPLLREEEDGSLWYCDNPADHFKQSYPWSASPKAPAKSIVEVGKITTLHKYGYYGFFKPSVAEVLAQVVTQIDPGLLEDVDYFVVDGPEDADDLNKHKDALNAGFHVATTTLYSLDGPN